jgi:hypothetical protein
MRDDRFLDLHLYIVVSEGLVNAANGILASTQPRVLKMCADRSPSCSRQSRPHQRSRRE